MRVFIQNDYPCQMQLDAVWDYLVPSSGSRQHLLLHTCFKQLFSGDHLLFLRTLTFLLFNGFINSSLAAQVGVALMELRLAKWKHGLKRFALGHLRRLCRESFHC